jgi:hypothetical protein
MNCISRFSFAVLVTIIAAWPCEADTTGDTVARADSYAVVVKESTAKDAAWKKVVDALIKKHDATLITYETSVTESLVPLKKEFPRYTCFVAQVDDAGREFVAEVHQLTRVLDDDPYTDTFWAILSGYDAENALEIAEYSEPLVIKKVGSGTEFAAEMVTEGQWYDELVKNKHVKKEPGGKATELSGPDDTTKSLVDTLNVYQPDLFITSGHATEREWVIGFRFRSGQFKCADGRLYGLDTKRARHTIDSPNPKVYMPIGNCLMGHLKDRDAMALAWMNSAGVKQMIGYTIPTGYGYGGWGCLDYFVEQPGRYTFVEAFQANHHALIHRINDPATTPNDRRRLRGDRDVVAIYGDPKWSAKMAEMPKYYGQALEFDDGVFTLTITPNRGEDSFKPVNMNGSERGWRPIVQFLPDRIKDVSVISGQDLEPTITDDFILVPNPRQCDPKREYVIKFKASLAAPIEASPTPTPQWP